LHEFLVVFRRTVAGVGTGSVQVGRVRGADAGLNLQVEVCDCRSVSR